MMTRRAAAPTHDPRAGTLRSLRRAHRLHKAGELGRALVLYEKVLEAEPRNAPALHYAAILGRQLNDLARANGRPTKDDEVMSLMAASIAADPTNAAGLHNFAKFKHDRGELEEARHLYEHAVAIDPAQGESWTNLGNVYGELGNRLRAEACWSRALEVSPGAPDARYNISFLHLLKGNWEQAWRDYECRWQCPDFAHGFGRPDLRKPRWDGRPMRGTLYLHQEQGAGDAIMMMRYIALAQQRAGRVVVEVVRGLVSLFAAMLPGVDVVAKGDAPPRHDAQLPMLSLPLLFGTTLQNVPPQPSFWPQSDENRPIEVDFGRIGLCWRGSTTHVNDRIRSMPFEAVFPLLDVPGVSWQSLQFGYDVEAPLEPLSAGDFLETARQIARCGLVITVDTSIAHLAGTLGVWTWLLLPYCAEWRWLQGREDSPWYPTVKLLRQEKAGDWRSLTKRAAAALSPRRDP